LGITISRVKAYVKWLQKSRIPLGDSLPDLFQVTSMKRVIRVMNVGTMLPVIPAAIEVALIQVEDMPIRVIWRVN
jgi:hypothetical protein